jgi:hypothetical protein
MAGHQNLYEMRSSGITKSIALGFKVTFEAIVAILLLALGATLVISLFSGPPFRFLTGPDLFVLLLSLMAFLIGLALLFGVIALQIRNNDLLMDIRDGQRDLNETLRELVRLVRQG